MPRKPRIGIPGFYHVLNRGVERRTVFEEPADYKKFKTLLKKQSEVLGAFDTGGPRSPITCGAWNNTTKQAKIVLLLSFDPLDPPLDPFGSSAR
ncbi:hypothetical protein [Hydrogenimonas sp.]